jgi:hypothetical protein
MVRPTVLLVFPPASQGLRAGEQRAAVRLVTTSLTDCFHIDLIKAGVGIEPASTALQTAIVLYKTER